MQWKICATGKWIFQNYWAKKNIFLLIFSKYPLDFIIVALNIYTESRRISMFKSKWKKDNYITIQKKRGKNNSN